MKHLWTLWIFIMLLALAIAGCHQNRTLPRSDFANVGRSAEHRDAAVLGAADDITQANTANPNPESKAGVDKGVTVIRTAVAAAPAADTVEALRKVTAERDAALAEVTRLQRLLAEAGAWAKKLIYGILFGGAAILVAAGVFVAFTGAQIPLFGPKAGTGIAAAGGALFALGLASSWCDNHPRAVGWALAGIAAIVAGSVGIMISNHWHETKRKADELLAGIAKV